MARNELASHKDFLGLCPGKTGSKNPRFRPKASCGYFHTPQAPRPSGRTGLEAREIFSPSLPKPGSGKAERLSPLIVFPVGQAPPVLGKLPARLFLRKNDWRKSCRKTGSTSFSRLFRPEAAKLKPALPHLIQQHDAARCLFRRLHDRHESLPVFCCHCLSGQLHRGGNCLPVLHQANAFLCPMRLFFKSAPGFQAARKRWSQ